MGLTKSDFTIGAIDRVAVRRGVTQGATEHLLIERAGLSRKEARNLAAHWFSRQFRDGGIEVRRAEYLARLNAEAA